MTTTATPLPFAIETEAIRRYFYWTQILTILAAGIWFFGAGIVVAALHGLFWAPRLTRQQADGLRYWLEGSTLRVDQGVYFLKRKSIPLDRVTDVILVQGPLMRHFGIWSIRVQTAGMGQGIPEATLYGLSDAPGVRDRLLAERDRAAAGRPIG